MASNVKPVPDCTHTLTPYLCVRGAAKALDFYARAFGAQEIYRLPGPGGMIMHSETRIGDSVLMVGDENPAPELRSVSLVGANYGLGYRNLGTVGVVGPLRMDYGKAIRSVRSAAHELSRFVEDVYAED